LLQQSTTSVVGRSHCQVPKPDFSRSIRHDGEIMTMVSSDGVPGWATQAGGQRDVQSPLTHPTSIMIDKTIATIFGAMGSAALAAAVAGGTALISKVDGTAQQLEKGRTERIQQYGEITKNISVVEMKVGQLSVQIDQLEIRLTRSLERDLQNRDKRMDQINEENLRIREQLLELSKEVGVSKRNK
jgi:hypothetical protein